MLQNIPNKLYHKSFLTNRDYIKIYGLNKIKEDL